MKNSTGMATLKASAQLPLGQGAKARAVRKPTPKFAATLALAIALIGQAGIGAATSAPLNVPQAGANSAPAAARGVGVAPAATKGLGVAPAMPTGPTDQTKVPHYFGPWPNWALSPLTNPDVTVGITGDGSGATATATVGANGSVTGLTLNNPGSGYTAATVDITGAGTGATAEATVAASGAVTSVAVGAGGTGYTAPTVSFSGGGGTGTLVQVGNQLNARTFATDYATPPGTLGPVFVVVPTTMPLAGKVTEIQYFNQATTGSSPTPSAGNLFHAYVLHATGVPNEYTVLWDSGPQTVPATADPVGVVETIVVPNIAVTTGDTIAFYGEGIPLDDAGGTDILSTPALTAPVLGGTVTLDGPDFPIYNQTRTYSFAASVLDASGVVALTGASATAYGSVAITLGAAGAGYSFPTVDIDYPDGPDGTQATAHVECVETNCAPATDGATVTITGIVVDNAGSGYSTAPNVVIRNGTIADPVNGGPDFVAATATATLAIDSITVDNPGDGYISAPTVTIADPTGAGATATATVSAGAITSVTLTAPGSGYITAGGIKKFTDPLPGVCDPATAGSCPDWVADPTAKAIPLGVPELKKYEGVEADEFVIGLVQYRAEFSSSMPEGALVRGYVQLETPDNFDISQHFPLTNANVDPTKDPTPVLINDVQAYGVTPPQYLGPFITATKDKPVRIVFHNLLPKGSDGDLFLPTDTTLMGSGMGPDPMTPPDDLGTVIDGVRNPTCTDNPQDPMCFNQNRATLHLHGGITPWISDGTPHQWITPAGDGGMWPEGVSVENVPDMQDPADPTAVMCAPADDGCSTFYYTNQQSARLMFYHDHAWGITRLNVYAGEAAGYTISDDTEKKLVSSGTIPAAADTIPLIVQDRTFVPDVAQLKAQDPTWDTARWGTKGNFWYHHVYMPAQNPGDPGGMSAYGRWMYGPWFWPPATPTHGPIDNPYYNMDPATDFTTALATPCNLDDPATWQYDTDPFCEPKQIPGTPNISVGMEQFNDTPIVNGTAYPTITLDPKTYRLRILNAANDRFFNFQWYVGDPDTASTDTNTLGQTIGATEVALKPAELAAAQTDPVVFPTPVDANNNAAGPDWIQIASEGGFLPAPTVVDGQQPTTWITDPTRFDVGNVDLHSLVLAPAERADAIVDFSKFAGQTLILYNDAPAAYPARVPSYDYYTGAPDQAPNGAPGILPGYGPNSRTIMQVKIAASPAAPAFNLTNLQKAFSHKADGSGVFESGQHPIIVGQQAYNSAYGTKFAASSNCNAPGSKLTKCDGLVRVNNTGPDSFGFNTLTEPTKKMTMGLEPKAIHDEMNSTTFDEFGRMTANLGIEAQPPTPGLQNVTLYPYVNPSTELIDATNLPKQDVTYGTDGLPEGDIKIAPISTASDGTQIWRFTHNGVDTHPIHFHLYDVQVLNRVTWDNIIIPTEPSELGWKDTVRMSPLEDTIVALRPIIPEVPFEVPNAIRPLNPMDPLGSTALFNNIDPQGNPTTAITNQLVNFGWEYVLHCHILSHEEMDMMRPVSVALPPRTPTGLAFTFNGKGKNANVVLTWTDNSITETSFAIQRTIDKVNWIDVGTIDRPLDQANTKGTTTFTDTTSDAKTVYQYRVVARNLVGYGGAFPSLTAASTSETVTVQPLPDVPADPTSLTATAQFGPQVNLTWTDNATNETGFLIERSTVADIGPWTAVTTVPARNNTGSVSYLDKSVAPATNYWYRVTAINLAGSSGPSNVANVAIGALTAAPTGVTATAARQGGSSERLTATWTPVTGATGYTIQWSRTADFATIDGSGTVAANSTTFTSGNLARVIWYVRVGANNAVGTAWSTPPVQVAAAQ